MTAAKRHHQRDTAPLLQVSGLDIDTPEGRPLFRGLTITLARERVALIGRNGVGKSTLLEFLAGHEQPRRGRVVLHTSPLLVRQDPTRSDPMEVVARLSSRAVADRAFAAELAHECSAAGLRPLFDFLADFPAELLAEPLAEPLAVGAVSRGEARKLHLLAAKLAQPDLLILDEPTEDLDARGLVWLCDWLADWTHGLLVVSHDRRLLGSFQHFFVVAESGCRYVPGTLADLERDLERANADRQRQYARNLGRLAECERRNETIKRRRRRKKNVGRIREIGRAPSRALLNAKRGYAQESQARVAKIREDRIAAVRTWARATRRALTVTLPLHLFMPRLPDDDGRDIVALTGVSAHADERLLFTGIDLRVRRDRLAVVGPNGAGKTTLLRIALGNQTPATGSARADLGRIGVIAQGGTDWMSDASLLEHLSAQVPHGSAHTSTDTSADTSTDTSPDALARLLVGHKFPLGLAERPLRSLSPGERVRAALICLFSRTPAVELLVLDEPNYSLDFAGGSALRDALRAWPGGLLIASHDRDFLASIGIDRELRLDGSGGHEFALV